MRLRAELGAHAAALGRRLAEVAACAGANTSVLVLGPRGVGKTLVRSRRCIFRAHASCCGAAAASTPVLELGSGRYVKCKQARPVLGMVRQKRLLFFDFRCSSACWSAWRQM